MQRLTKLILLVTIYFSASSLQADPTTVNFLINEYNRNFDISVKSEILKTLKDFSQQANVQSVLMNTLSNERNFTNLRLQAAYSLSAQTKDSFVLNQILRAHDRSRDLNFRAGLLESIYPAVASNLKVTNVLKNNLLQNHDPTIQQASAFSLGKNIEQPQIKSFLMERSESPFLADNVRIEILKSFYTQLNDPKIKDYLQRVALSPRYSEAMRSAATRILATAPKTRSSRQTLVDLLSRSQFSTIKAQAAAGLRFELSEEDIQWMRLSTDPRSGTSRDPFSRL